MTLFPLAKKALSVRKDPLVNVLHVILVDEHSEKTNLLEQAEAYLKLVGQSLLLHNIRRVTFSARPQNIENISAHNADMALYPNIYIFPGRLNYSEAKIVRHMEAPLAYKLELRRLQNYSVTPLASENKNVHLYLAKMKGSVSHIVPTPSSASSCARWCASLTTTAVARASTTTRTRALSARLWMP
ncbi:hypothetical protein DVH05_021005 [Phytophthora capsici]|nr:hypothetical protein DVH05_021005 [Phytophthora capsici]